MSQHLTHHSPYDAVDTVNRINHYALKGCIMRKPMRFVPYRILRIG